MPLFHISAFNLNGAYKLYKIFRLTAVKFDSKCWLMYS